MQRIEPAAYTNSTYYFRYFKIEETPKEHDLWLFVVIFWQAFKRRYYEGLRIVIYFLLEHILGHLKLVFGPQIE